MSPLLAPALVAAAVFTGPKPDPGVLVRQLGAPDYRDREAAGKALRLFQCAAEPAVRAGARDPNPEVARRAADVLRLRRLDAEWRATAGTADRPTPAWKAFRELAGDTPESRALYRELTADGRYDRLARAVADPDAAAIGYAAELARTEAAYEKEFPRRGCGGLWVNRRGVSLAAVPRDDVSLVMFLGSLAPADAAADPKLVRSVLDEGFRDLVGGARGPGGPALYAAWLDRRRNPEAVADGLYAALTGAIAEALPAARRVLADPTADARPVGYALLVLGNHGDPAEDGPRLAKFRDDARVFHQWGGGGQTFTIQLRDVAAGLLLLAAGEEAKGYGFDWVRRGPADPADGPSYREVGWFASDAERAAAHAKAWAWLDDQPPAKK